ncbi:MAG: hypothetical protein COB42_03445 [Sulfurimonas sp.]|nr:MAG: hypothetical protein COB42_03445 [Sulfurimonas sp.]
MLPSLTNQDCKEQHPLTFEWAKIIDIESDDNISLFAQVSTYIVPSLRNQCVQLNASYKELFEKIDTDNNNKLDPQELEDAAKNKTIKQTTANYIVKHSSEWDDTTNMADVLLKIFEQHEDEFSDIEEIKKHYTNQKERITKLSFFKECKGIEGFPQDDMVYHMNVVGLVGEFGGCKEILSKELLKKAFKNATTERINEYHPVINNALCLYKHSDLKSIAYFLGQASAETGDLKYKEEMASGSLYEGRASLGNTQVGDGKRFKGRGMIQLTGRTNYEGFEKYAKENISKYSTLDITSSDDNAQKLVTNLELNVLASLWYWTKGGKGPRIQKSILTDDIFWISVYVNGATTQSDYYYSTTKLTNKAGQKIEPNHMKVRVERTNIAKTALGV